MKKVVFILFFFILQISLFAQKYYVSSSAGDDSNDGLTPQTAWRSTSKVNNFIAGLSASKRAVIAFKCGDEWDSRIVFERINQAQHLTLTSYGTGNKPKINVVTIQTLTWTNLGNNIWKNTTLTRPVPRMLFDGIEVLGATAYSQLGLNVSGDGLHPQSLVKFYSDRSNNYLYIYSTDNPSNHQIKFTSSANGQVIYIGNSQNITIENFEIEGGYYAGIGIYGSQNITIRNSDLGYLTGFAGIEIDKRNLRTSNFLVENCVIDTKFTIDYSGAKETEYNSV